MTTDNPVHLPESTHPYAVCVSLVLGSNVELNLSDEDVPLRFADNYTLKVVKEITSPKEETNGLQRVSVHLEAFPTDSEAEQAGELLVLSILWVAASRGVTIAFEKWTGKFPFSIRNRTQSIGVVGINSFRGDASSHQPISLKDFSSIAEEAYKQRNDLPTHVLASMEFYASARMESTERSRFIMLITALEALSKQNNYGGEVEDLLGKLASKLENSPALAGEGKASLKDSLSGRLKDLNRESVRQAIVRTLKENDLGENIKFIEKAYGIRSKILHTGHREAELHDFTDRLDKIMRQLYSAVLGLEPERPV